MTQAEYEKIPGLSLSALRDLAISPLTYWHRWINPDRAPAEPTPAMLLGEALHCAVLEPNEFDKRFAREVVEPPGCLHTIEEIRAWLRDRGVTPKGTRKADVIDLARFHDPNVPIYDVLAEAHELANHGKHIFKSEDWERVAGMARALLAEPVIRKLLEMGPAATCAEQARTIQADLGFQIKGRIDWLTPSNLIIDLKTFSQQRGKPIDKCVLDAIWYERYYWTALWYTMLLRPHSSTFLLAFVESEAPYEVRIRSLVPSISGQANVYWTRAGAEIRQLLQLYLDCTQRFGEKPWRTNQEIDPLLDDEIPQMHF